MLEQVADKVRMKGKKPRQMVLPHCTWDKFGELLSENGARSLTLVISRDILHAGKHCMLR